MSTTNLQILLKFKKVRSLNFAAPTEQHANTSARSEASDMTDSEEQLLKASVYSAPQPQQPDPSLDQDNEHPLDAALSALVNEEVVRDIAKDLIQPSEAPSAAREAPMRFDPLERIAGTLPKSTPATSHNIKAEHTVSLADTLYKNNGSDLGINLPSRTSTAMGSPPSFSRTTTTSTKHEHEWYHIPDDANAAVFSILMIPLATLVGVELIAWAMYHKDLPLVCLGALYGNNMTVWLLKVRHSQFFKSLNVFKRRLHYCIFLFYRVVSTF